MEFIANHNLTGLLIGVGTFIIIGLFHPLVIKGEYYLGVKCWWMFLLAGIAFLIAAVSIKNILLSSLCGVTAFSAFWGIGELFAQRRRVQKGWFPSNPKRNKQKKQDS